MRGDTSRYFGFVVPNISVFVWETRNTVFRFASTTQESSKPTSQVDRCAHPAINTAISQASGENPPIDQVTIVSGPILHNWSRENTGELDQSRFHHLSTLLTFLPGCNPSNAPPCPQITLVQLYGHRLWRLAKETEYAQYPSHLRRGSLAPRLSSRATNVQVAQVSPGFLASRQILLRDNNDWIQAVQTWLTSTSKSSACSDPPFSDHIRHERLRVPVFSGSSLTLLGSQNVHLLLVHMRAYLPQFHTSQCSRKTGVKLTLRHLRLTLRSPIFAVVRRKFTGSR